MLKSLNVAISNLKNHFDAFLVRVRGKSRGVGDTPKIVCCNVICGSSPIFPSNFGIFLGILLELVSKQDDVRWGCS